MPLHVISDLHIGAGKLDDCDQGCEDALVAFFDRATATPGRVEVVLNGDSFDFVQADPWRMGGLEGHTVDGVPLCFTCPTSLRKAQAIVDAQPRIFDALSRLVRRDGAKLTIMPGNHDADLYWEPVRRLIDARIHGSGTAAEGRLVWHLERVLRPVSAPHVWIEHGHQYDPLNSFFVSTARTPIEYWGALRPPILPDADGQDRLLECIGTRFLIRFLNELDFRYPFVDNIKPLSRFLHIFGSSARHLSGGTARAALSTLAFMRFVGVEAATAPGNLLAAATDDGSIGARLRAIDAATEGAFADVLRAAGCDFRGRSFDSLSRDADEAVAVLDFALDHLDALDAVQLDAEALLALDNSEGDVESGELSLAKGFNIDETQLLREAASDALKSPGCRFVVMGHTHEAVDEPAYKNTGSWTRYWQLESDEAPSWREMLKRAPSLPMALRCATVHDDPAHGVTLDPFVPGT